MYPSSKFPSYGVFVKNFCEQLGQIGVNYRVSALTKTQNKILRILKYLWFYLRTFFRCWLGGYDLVYIHYPSFSAVPVNAAHRLRKFGVIANVHGTDVVPLKVEHEKMMKNTDKAIANSSLVVVPSEYFKLLVAEKYGLESERVFVYPSAGVNEEIFYPYDADRKADLRREYGVEDDTAVIGFVSRINKAKGWDVFLDALKKSSALRNKKLKLFIVGSGEDDEALAEKIKELPENLRDAVIRYPLLEQRKLAEIYNIINVFVFPTVSASESLGLVAVEAMACGTPVIASDFAAPAYYVIDGGNGYKFEKGNSDALAAKTDEFFTLSEDEGAKLIKGALETGRSYYRRQITEKLRSIF